MFEEIIFRSLRHIEEMLRQILRRLGDDENEPSPVAIALALPALTRNGVPMNFPVANDAVYTIDILTRDSAGVTVPAPAGDVFTVQGSTADLSVTINPTGGAAGGPALVVAALAQTSPPGGIPVTVTDSAGLQSDVQLFDIVADLAPKSIALDLANATTAPQAVPTPPGP